MFSTADRDHEQQTSVNEAVKTLKTPLNNHSNHNRGAFSAPRIGPERTGNWVGPREVARILHANLEDRLILAILVNTEDPVVAVGLLRLKYGRKGLEAVFLDHW